MSKRDPLASLLTQNREPLECFLVPSCRWESGLAWGGSGVNTRQSCISVWAIVGRGAFGKLFILSDP